MGVSPVSHIPSPLPPLPSPALPLPTAYPPLLRRQRSIDELADDIRMMGPEVLDRHQAGDRGPAHPTIARLTATLRDAFAQKDEKIAALQSRLVSVVNRAAIEASREGFGAATGRRSWVRVLRSGNMKRRLGAVCPAPFAIPFVHSAPSLLPSLLPSR